MSTCTIPTAVPDRKVNSNIPSFLLGSKYSYTNDPSARGRKAAKATLPPSTSSPAVKGNTVALTVTPYFESGTVPETWTFPDSLETTAAKITISLTGWLAGSPAVSLTAFSISSTLNKYASVGLWLPSWVNCCTNCREAKIPTGSKIINKTNSIRSITGYILQ